MHIGIFADTHDHLDHIAQAVEVFNRERCEMVLFAGDFVSSIAIPPLRKLNCPVLACYGDNEGNRRGVAAGMRIVGELGDGPLCYRSPDGVRMVLAHFRKQLAEYGGDFDVGVYAHTHRARIHHDPQGRLLINPGETSGWTYRQPSVAVLETVGLAARLIRLDEPVPAEDGTSD